jgi:hypothetical protein
MKTQKSKYLIISAVMIVFAVALVVEAKSNKAKQVIEGVPSKGRATVSIPAHAVQVAPGIFSLGTAQENGRTVEGYAFVRYKKAPGKRSRRCGNNICEKGENAKNCSVDCGGGTTPDASSCYGFLAKGAKWKTAEPYMINPANSRGMDEGVVGGNFVADASTWNVAAETAVLGQGTSTNSILAADTISPDGNNEVYFGSIDDSGAIAITIVWGIFGGPPKQRELIEWDQVYDQVDFDWSTSGEVDKMDFSNIAVHELGHSAGMKDLYTSECAEQTMYGYATEGETKKQTLESGDITGIQKLY